MSEQENNLKKHSDLYKRSIRGGGWVAALNAATHLFSIVKFWIVYNFLFNENLELILVANLFMAALATFSESGFRAALVQKKDNIADYLDTAWVICILRGVVLFTLIYFTAPLFALFKVEPEKVSLTISIIRAMGICFLIRAFQNIGTVFFKKELEFHKTFWLTMAGTITDIVLSITLVLVYRSVWAYVFARLVSAMVNLVMSYVLCPYRPSFHFVPEKARELWKFGKWLFGANIIGYLLNEGDDYFVLFYFGDMLPFKLYRGAYRFANIPATHITNVISQISFPAYSKIQNDIARLRDAYLKILRTIAIISVPIGFLIFVLGPNFVKLFLVPESHGMTIPLQIIALQGLLKAEGATRGSLFNALGQPQISVFFQCIRLILLAILTVPLTIYFGITGTATATVLVTLSTKPLGFLKTCKLLKCSASDLLKPNFVPVVSALMMAVLMILLNKVQIIPYAKISFFMQIGIGLMIYLGLLYLLDGWFNHGHNRLIREILKTTLKNRFKIGG